MAANRYARIYHSDHHYINLRFPSADARREFATKFEEYHEGHDHDGEVPRFEDTPAATIGNMAANTVHDAHSVSIDGYATYEIEDYHNPSRWNTYNRSRYRPPTCCVPPVISINRTFIDSSTLTRHELSAIFMDMPEEDFQNLLTSVETDGFKDPVIRMIDTQVLDGWHRYRAAKELNLLRKLRFQQWDEKDEGDPAVFVYARNQNRRHQPQSIRTQIAIAFNKRFGHGTNRFTLDSPNGDSKTRKDLAKEAGVSERTIDRAVQIEKAGRADEVLTGEKTAGEVIKEETLKSLWEQINPAISEWKQAREGVGYASKTMFIKATLRWEGLESDTETDVKVLKILLYLLTTTDTNILEELIRKQLDGKSLWDGWDDAADVSDETEPEPPAPTETDREAQRLLKQKKMVLKAMWETRKEASKVWMGDADNDLLTLDLKELEKGFVENNPAYAEAFKVAMQRTSVASLEELIERVLILDIGVDQLEKENRALTTYIGDLRNWDRPDWSPDTNWILPLIAAKKAAAAPEPEATEPVEPTEDMDALWAAFNKRLPTWRAKYAESGYKENDLIQAATEVELFDALRSYRHSEQTGLPTPNEIKDLTGLMKRQSYPFSRHVRNLLRAKSDGRASADLPIAQGLASRHRKSGEGFRTDGNGSAHRQRNEQNPRPSAQACEIDASPLVSVEDEGLSEIDWQYDRNQRTVLRTLIAPLLEKIGATDAVPVLNRDLRRNIAADILDVFISYENPPADKQMVMILLDVIDAILSEPIE